MPKLDRKQAREVIEGYLAQHPNATVKEIANLLGVSKQRAYILLKLVGMTTQKQRKDHKPQRLTERETKILRCVAGGMTNRQIAEAFGVTERTIKNEFTLILAKLNANNRAHAVALAIQEGLIPLNKLKRVKTASK
jgi:DNA-binding CsgD family transcriptional regulator